MVYDGMYINERGLAMKLHFRVLSTIASVIVLIACIAPLCASADFALPDWAFPFESYTDSYEESLQEIEKQDLQIKVKG